MAGNPCGMLFVKRCRGIALSKIRPVQLHAADADARKDEVHDGHDNDDLDDHRGIAHQVIVPRVVDGKGHEPPQQCGT